MRTCTVCGQTKPNTSFPATKKVRSLLSSWCIECYRTKRAEWKASSPNNTKAWKEEERGPYADPVQWAGLHCRHISDYVTKVVTRFESKTGMEVPPQLLAIRQIADESAKQLPERGPAKRRAIACRNCGRTFYPKKRGYLAAYCSSYCKERIKQVFQAFESAGQGADK